MFTYKPEASRVPIKVWLHEEDYYKDLLTIEQIERLSRLPFVYKHVVLNSDGHCGFGMPIGGVCATQKVISPAMVGFDIGCGMIAVRTNVNIASSITKGMLQAITNRIKELIPVGFNWHEKDQSAARMPIPQACHEIVILNFNKALKQLGTLGGGKLVAPSSGV